MARTSVLGDSPAVSTCFRVIAMAFARRVAVPIVRHFRRGLKRELQLAGRRQTALTVRPNRACHGIVVFSGEPPVWGMEAFIGSMTTDPRAVVLSHGPGGLGVARSLARRGVHVSVFSYEADDLVLRSRFPRTAKPIPGDSDADKERALLEILLTFGENKPVLLMSSDRMVAFVGRHRKQLAEHFRFCIPNQNLLTTLNDKRLETRLLSSIGVPVPATVEILPPDISTLETMLSLPVIFKPHSYAVQHVFSHKNVVATKREALQEFYSAYRDVLPDLLAQEVIPGPDDASWICSCTFDRAHQLLDCSIKRKLRMYPPHYGPSSLAISCSNEELDRVPGRGVGVVGASVSCG